MPALMTKRDPATVAGGRLTLIFLAALAPTAEADRAGPALAAIPVSSSLGTLTGPRIWGSTCLVIVAIVGTIGSLMADRSTSLRDQDGAIHRF